MTGARGFYGRIGKRAFDLFFTLAIAPVLLPLGVLLAVLVRFDLGSPVLFRQRRIGRDAHPFTLAKLRTMSERTGRNGRLAPDQDRLSRLGTLLRRTSLDEIPEFFNILRGDMSVVGPRPLLPEYLPLYSERQARRHDVRPGLTGLAQVRGRNVLSWEDRLESDVEYVERLSFVLDISILVRTCWMIFTGHGVSAPGHATMPPFTGSQPDPGIRDRAPAAGSASPTNGKGEADP